MSAELFNTGLKRYESIITPYPYQVDLIRDTLAALAVHRRVCTQSPAGSGKTVVFNEVIRRCVNKGYNCLVIAHREELILQPREKLYNSCGIVSGIIKSGYEPMPTMPVQIASIQTLTKRNKPQNIKIIIIDEAHHATSDTYMAIQKEYPEAKIWGVTATPTRSSGEGLEKAFDVLVTGPQIKFLEDSGFLVPAHSIVNPLPAEYFANCRITGGDYNEKDLANLMDRDEMTEDLVKNYLAHANGLRNCVFAVNVEHSKKIVAAYKQAGIAAMHVDGNTPASERNRIFNYFKAGKFWVLSNVGIATEGTDIPAIECVQGARPSKSLSLVIQMMGRGARTAKDKKRYVLLDHANWIIEHGAPNAHRTWTLKGKKINPKEQRVRQFRLIYPNGGGERIVNSLTIPKNLKGVQLIEITDEFRVNTFEKLSRIAAQKSFNKWWAFFKWLADLETMPSLLELQYIGKKMECKPGWAAFYREKLERLDNFKDILTPQSVAQ